MMEDNPEIKTANARVLLLKRTRIDDETRIFALTFGYGKLLFDEDVIEDQFGLKIVLNTISRDKIRKISKADIGKNYKQSQEQMPKESQIRDFGFDINRDLIKYITGKAEDSVFGKCIITGGDLFNVLSDANIENVDELLKYCYKKYKLTNYKDDFSWIDNIKYIKDNDLINKLNAEVVNLFNKKEFDKVWLAIPEVIDWASFKTLIIGKKIDDNDYNDIDMNVFMKLYPEEKILSFDKIKEKNIKVISKDDEEIKSWKASNCIVGNIEFEDETYAINGGKWYKINTEFVNEINSAYNALKLSKMEFVDCPSNYIEDQYNELLIENLVGSQSIHKYKISIGGGSGNNIEPCDIAVGKTFIFIKYNGGSSYLSHLFNQASVSSQALMDNKFRIKFKEKLLEKNINNIISDDFNTNDYTIVVGIINKYHDERPKIPFFSKVSIKYTSELILNLGYNFEIKNIKKIK